MDRLEFGYCELCETEHYTESMHAYDKDAFKRNFREKFGRNPTYEDAFSHCGEDMLVPIRQVLNAYKIDTFQEVP